MNDIDPKLLKVIALAKGGFGGERESAIRVVRRICERQGLDFNAVMTDNDGVPKQHIADIKVRTKDELRICIQVAARFATRSEYPDVRGAYFSFDRSVRLWYTCTTNTHIDTINALEIYLRAYRKEKKNILEALKTAFTHKHSLYQQFEVEGDEPEPEISPEERRKRRLENYRAAQVLQGLTEDVTVRKVIGDGNNR